MEKNPEECGAKNSVGLTGKSPELKSREPGSLAISHCVTLGVSFLILKRRDLDLIFSEAPYGSNFGESE